MEIKQFKWDIIDTNSWLLKENNSGILVDAVDSQNLYNELEQLDDIVVILTHSHFDHIFGLNTIRQLKPNTVVVSTEKCSEYIGNIYRNMSSSATAFMKFYDAGSKKNIEIDPFICNSAEKTFVDKMILNWFEHSIQLVAVHGHSEDGLLAILDNKYLFSGDTLLHTPTITRFPTGSTQRFITEDLELLKSMKYINNVYPGHGKCDTIRFFLSINHNRI